jgi:DNA-binding transcriptional ArsR family regulator
MVDHLDQARARLVFGLCKVAGRLTGSGPRSILKQMANQSDSLDIVFHALSDATRRGIVERLSQGPASVSELARPFAMSLPAAMQHLQVLEASGLVHSEKIGRVRTCRLELKKLSLVQHWINERRALWEARLDRLDAFLAESPADNELGE